jgi:hypothetical protein
MYPLPPQVGRGADLSTSPLDDRIAPRRGAPQALRFDPPPPGGLILTPLAPPASATAPGGAWSWLRALWPARSPRAAPAR